ncbi:unknown protein [Seminavis robusta]|uniref:Uncharacterized protein n=1 Tax=Seminavis robusta TaxID=568900 RepID=A0A9N8HZ54_9STRA|nr:unknown protein [Seminavis robusta]|eukprot:Sro2777_g336870.1 n/a (236) ;mRNA; r:3359-4066
MMKWYDDTKIQHFSLGCLALFLYDSWEGSLEVNKIHGIQAIVRAMRSFPRSEDVQESAMLALANGIVTDEDIDYDVGTTDDFKEELKVATREMSKLFVEELDGIALVVNAMTAFPNHQDVQMSGCSLLAKLSHREEFFETMKNTRAVGVVGMILGNFAGDVELIGKATRFMVNVWGTRMVIDVGIVADSDQTSLQDEPNTADTSMEEQEIDNNQSQSASENDEDTATQETAEKEE